VLAPACAMTGGAFIPTAADEEYDLDEHGRERHSVQWMGMPGVKGPKWAKMPLLTVGMLGIQVSLAACELLRSQDGAGESYGCRPSGHIPIGGIGR
jgi:hypothetical protein